MGWISNVVLALRVCYPYPPHHPKNVPKLVFSPSVGTSVLAEEPAGSGSVNLGEKATMSFGSYQSALKKSHTEK